MKNAIELHSPHSKQLQKTMQPNWERQRLKFSVLLNPSKKEMDRNLSDATEVSFIPMEAVSEKGLIDTSRLRPINEVSSGYTYFRNGDVVVAKITPCFENGKGAIAENLHNGIGFGTTELTVLRANNDLDCKFLYYLLSCYDFRRQAEGEMYGAGGQKRVPDDFFRNFVFLKPPITHQKKVANFLDQKTASVDELIEKKERQIELLNEKRQALISHAITKGLNPNVTNRNSGINRPDVIPSHWQVRKISRSFMLIGSGTTPDSNNTSFYENGSIPWLNTGDLNDDYISDIPKKITVQAFKHFSALKIYPSDTVIVALYGATIGKVGILTSEACTNQACCALSKSPFFIPKFVYYWFLSNKKDIIRQSYGGGQPNISQELLKNQMMVSPPLEEQQQIVNFLDFNIQNIDNIIQKIRLQVERLEEFRKSLIKEAITGNFKIGKQEFLNAI